MGQYGRTGRTHDDYVQDLGKKRNDVEVVGRYVGYTTPIELRCKKCDTHWDANPRLTLCGKGKCPRCRGESISKSLVINGQANSDSRILRKFGGSIRRVGPYIDAMTKTEYVCDKGHTIIREPRFVIGTLTGCFKCGKERGGRAHRLPLEEYLKLVDKKRMTYIRGYEGLTPACWFRCKTCKREFKRSARAALNRGCNLCSTENANFMVRIRKPIRLGRRTVEVDGYEHHAIRHLLQYTNPRDIRVSSEHVVPVIHYLSESGKIKRHYPDILVGTNLLIEVKSPWTAGLIDNPTGLRALQRKSLAAKKAGYQYIVMIIDPSALDEPIALPKRWEHMNVDRLCSWAARHEVLGRE